MKRPRVGAGLKVAWLASPGRSPVTLHPALLLSCPPGAETLGLPSWLGIRLGDGARQPGSVEILPVGVGRGPS